MQSLQAGFGGPLVPVPCPPPPPSCSRTASCLAASVPSLASWPPQPWVLGAGQGLPAVSFLPFFGRKPGWWGAPGWSLSRGGGLGHHPVPQSDSAPCPHPSLGSLGHSGRWINGVAAHTGPRAQATPAGRPARRLSRLPWPALGTPRHLPRPREPLYRACLGVLCRSGGLGGGVGSEVISTQLRSLAPRLGRGDPGHPGVSRLDSEQQWGPFSARAGESPYGGCRAWLQELPPCQPL